MHYTYTDIDASRFDLVFKGADGRCQVRASLTDPSRLLAMYIYGWI